MVLQIGTDAGRVPQHGDAVLAENRAGTDARELQDLRRTNRPGAQDHLARRAHFQALAVANDLGADASQLAVVPPLDDQPAHLGPGPHGQVPSSVQHRAQERLRGVPAPAVLLVDLEVADAVVAAAVEVVAGRQAGLLGGLRECVEDFPAKPLLLYAPLSVCPMPARQFGDFGRHLPHHATGHEVTRQRERSGPPSSQSVEAIVALVRDEVLQRLLPAPGFFPRLPAHVDHAVDAGAAPQRLAARIDELAAVQAGVRLGSKAPVGARVIDAVEVPDRDVDPGMAILAPGLDEKHLASNIGTQPVGKQRARGAAADDDVVGDGRVHFATGIANSAPLPML